MLTKECGRKNEKNQVSLTSILLNSYLLDTERGLMPRYICMAKGTSTKASRKKSGRGKLLTTLLVIDALIILESIVQDRTLTSLISLVINGAILVGIWKWKKW